MRRVRSSLSSWLLALAAWFVVAPGQGAPPPDFAAIMARADAMPERQSLVKPPQPVMSANYEAADAPPANVWGIEQHTVPNATPPAEGSPPGDAYDPWLQEGWTPRRYIGRGIEFTREFCGIGTDWCPPQIDPSPTVTGYAFQGFETFRGIPDHSQINNGLVQGANLGMPVPLFSRLGLGYQVGASYGAYNLGGSPDRQIPTTDNTDQWFVTTGFFRRGTASCPVSMGVGYDWMITDNFGVFSQSPTLGQGRARLGYAFTARNEFGIQGSWRETLDIKNVNGTPTLFRPISQGSLFWNHKFLWRGAESMMWCGITDQRRANDDDSYGKMTFGGSFNYPLSDRLAIATNGQTWNTTTAGASRQQVYNFSVSLVFYPRRTARSSTIVGRQWMPYLPVANNANFMSDTNRVQ
ncbi:MAG: hypothetical protein JSS27_11605 [Planctomycetes bacterium]|nr:hypothetical protein [Planctomycetota bacterium]